MNKCLAIYDSDMTFASGLMEYFNRRRDLDFEYFSFSEEEYLLEFLSKKEVEVLLLGEGVSLDEEIAKNKIRYIYLLAERPKENAMTEHPTIFKYQAAASIVSQVISEYNKNNNDMAGIKSGKLEIISIYTPLADIIKYYYALSLSYSYTERKKVLWIPFDLFSTNFLLGEEKASHSLSEFIYYLKESNPNISLKEKELTRYYDGLAYLSGLTHGLDLISLTGEDVNHWLQLMRRSSYYDTVVFYLGIYTDATVEILRQSDYVYIISKEGFYEQRVLNEWERQMEFLGLKMDQDRYHKIKLPIDMVLDGKIGTLEDLKKHPIWKMASCELNHP